MTRWAGRAPVGLLPKAAPSVGEWVNPDRARPWMGAAPDQLRRDLL